MQESNTSGQSRIAPLRFGLLLLCYSLSGVAALIYQIAWVRQFSLVFGGAALSVVVVICSFMVGLMIGAAIVDRIQHHIRRPLLWFGTMETAIALVALVIPALMTISKAGYLYLFSGAGLDAASSPTALCYAFGSTAVILLIPTSLMGATLPMLARFSVVTGEQIATRPGLLYMANTFGAAGGTVIAAFVLLPAVGLDRTVYFGIGTNLVAGVIAIALHACFRTSPDSFQNSASESDQTLPIAQPRSFSIALPIAGFLGFIGFSYEIMWTRLVTPVLGGTIFAFASMLGTYLLGLSIGSGLAAIAGKKRWHPRLVLGWAVICGAFATVAGFTFASPLLEWIVDRGHQQGWSESTWFGAKTLWAVVLVLPGAIPLGAAFPLCVRLSADHANEALTASSRVFVWNTIGAVCGATATGLWLLPTLKFAGTAGLLSSLGIAISVALAAFLHPLSRPLIAGAMTAVVALIVGWPSSPWQVIRFSPLQNRVSTGKLRFYEVGKTTTVTAVESPMMDWKLQTDGLPESSIQPPGARFGRYSLARWMSLLPSTIRPEMNDILVVGLGGGIVVEELPEVAKRVDVIEIEQSVLDLNRYFGPRRRKDPLADERLTVHIGDARSSLLLTDQHFDAIISQPSHPFTSGGAQLYTQEFFQLASERLKERGVFIQWMGLQFVTEELLESLIATVCETFPHVDIYQPPPGSALLIAASNQPLDYDDTQDLVIRCNVGDWQKLGIFSAVDLRATRVARTEDLLRLSANARKIRDRHNLLQLQSPWRSSAPLSKVDATTLFLRFSESNQPNYAELLSMVRFGAFQRTKWHAERMPPGGDRYIIAGVSELQQGRHRKALAFFEKALRTGRLRPELIEGLALLKHQSALGRKIAPALDRVLKGDSFPDARAVTAAWEAQKTTGGWSEVQKFEEQLAAVSPDSLIFEEAQRLRVTWRVQSDDPDDAREAVELAQNLSGRLTRIDDSGRMLRAFLRIEDYNGAMVVAAEILSMLETNASLNHTMKVRATQLLANNLKTLPKSVAESNEAVLLKSRIQALNQGWKRSGNAGSPSKL